MALAAATPAAGPTRKRKRASDSVDLQPQRTPLATPTGSSTSVPIVRSHAQTASGQAALNRGLYLSFVDSAFSELKQGRSERYDELVAVFAPFSSARQSQERPDTGDLDQIRPMLEALSRSISSLSSSAHRTLLEALVGLAWTNFDEAVARAYASFVCAFVAGRPEWLARVVDRTIEGFRPPMVETAQVDALITRRQSYDRLHSLLRTLVDRVPLLPPTIVAQVRRHMPAPRMSRDVQLVYVRNVLRITDYCPSIMPEVLDAVVHHSVLLDVEIQTGLEHFENANGELDAAIFGFDIDSALDVRAGMAAEEDRAATDDDEGPDIDLDLDDISEGDPVEHRKLDLPMADWEAFDRVQGLAAKLDAVLHLTFEYLSGAHEAVGRTTPPGSGAATPTKLLPAFEPSVAELRVQAQAERAALFDLVLDLFDRNVLPTFKTRHVQFLVFWMASLDASYADAFVSSLLHRALYDVTEPVVSRVASAAYIASLVSRAQYISADTCRRVVLLLLEYVGQVIAATSTTVSALSMPQLTVFYASVQAVFYIFCFRWRELRVGLDPDADSDGEDADPMAGTTARWLPELETLRRAVHSSLNPYKYCTAAVVEQFTRVAHSTNFLYGFSVIDANKREAAVKPARPITIRRQSSVPIHSAAVQDALREAQLDTHFPFDPFKLPASSVYVRDLYRHWQAPPGADDEDETGESEPSTSLPRIRSIAIPITPPQPRRMGTDDALASFRAMSLSPDGPFGAGSLTMSSVYA